MIYLDDLKNGYCHMMADGDIGELHAFADFINVPPHQFNDHPIHPHYLITKFKRGLAIDKGAIPVKPLEFARINLKRIGYLK